MTQELANLAVAVDLFREGQTLEAIARRYGISKQAVHQRLKKAGVGRADGGAHKRHLSRVENKAEARERRLKERMLRTYGITAQEWRQYRDCGLLEKFRAHRSTSRGRGIAFELTFKEWLSVWTESGKLDERGKTSGKYVMSRRGDVGPYAVWNVFIQSHADNIREAKSRSGFFGRAPGHVLTSQDSMIP